MAESFGLGQRDWAGSFTVPTTGTLLVWIRTTEAYNSGSYRWYVNSGQNAPTVLRFDVYIHTDGNFYCGWYNNGNDHRVAVSASGLTTNVWHPLILTWANGGTTELFLDGSSLGTTATLDATWDTTSLGLCVGDSLFDNRTANAELAWVTFWNEVLSAGEIAALTRGAHPLRIRNSKIYACFKLEGVGSYSYSWAGLTSGLSRSGAAPKVPDPPVQLDRFGRMHFSEYAAAAITGSPWYAYANQ